MVSTKAVGLGIGALIATEATGITNLSGGGSGPIVVAPGNGGGGGGDMPIPIDTGDGGSGGLGDGFAEAISSVTESATSNASQVSELAAGQSTLVQRIKSLREDLDTVNETRETVSDVTNGNGAPSGISDLFMTQGPGDNPSPTGDTSTGLSDKQQAAKEVGRDPFGLQATVGGPVGAIAEGLRASGETVTDVTDKVGTPGADPEPGTFFGFVGDAGSATGEAYNDVREAEKRVTEPVTSGISDIQDSIQKTQDTINPFKSGWF